MPAADDRSISAAEAEHLFGHFANLPVLILAVSGGPDSTALLLLAARWRKKRRRGPKLIAVTVDHGLRPEAKAEARAVHRLARSLGVAHRTLRWTGPKPLSGVQEAARAARYRLLASAARKARAHHVLTAHTRDDQAETVLMRLLRGSGITGLSGMGPVAPLPVKDGGDLWLLRPLLDVPKSRLVATLKAAKIPYAEDRSNADPRFTRPRLRSLAPALAAEGLTADRLLVLARRAQRMHDAMSDMVFAARAHLAPDPWPAGGPVSLEAAAFGRLPEEIALRLLGWAIEWTGDEGPVELGKLEALVEALATPLVAQRHDLPEFARFRRTLAGAVVTLAGGRLRIERAPPRRASKRP